MRRISVIISVIFAAVCFSACGSKTTQEKEAESQNDQTMSNQSLTVNIRYTGKNGSARAFAEDMTKSGIVDSIRAEQGNLRYEYYFPMDDPETVLLIDSWENQEAIDRHHATPMMKQISDLREKYDLHMTVERYTRVEQVSQDDSFIRK